MALMLTGEFICELVNLLIGCAEDPRGMNFS